jgi:hypothetical protein
MILTSHKVLLLLGFSVIAPVFLMNVYASSPENYIPQITLISDVPFEQIDPSYKNLPLDHTKDAYVVYLDGNSISAKHTTAALLIDYTSSENFAIEGSCLNTYDASTGMQANDMCQQGVYFPVQYWTETQIGNFIILQ